MKAQTTESTEEVIDGVVNGLYAKIRPFILFSVSVLVGFLVFTALANFPKAAADNYDKYNPTIYIDSEAGALELLNGTLEDYSDWTNLTHPNLDKRHGKDLAIACAGGLVGGGIGFAGSALAPMFSHAWAKLFNAPTCDLSVQHEYIGDEIIAWRVVPGSTCGRRDQFTAELQRDMYSVYNDKMHAQLHKAACMICSDHLGANYGIVVGTSGNAVSTMKCYQGMPGAGQCAWNK